MAEGITTTDVRSTWESAAPGWAKWESKLAAELAGVTDTLIDMARVAPGMRVLDLACGAGSQSLQVAQRVGPNGRVLASDISATMLRHVQENADRAGLQNVETLECAAEDLDASDGPFDAAICRLGVMLFPSPQRALAGLHRALKPDARFAALVFTTPVNNPFMAQPLAILLRHAGKQPPPPGQPGIFALGQDGALQRLMEESGFRDVESRTVQARLELSSADEALQMMQEAFGVYRAVVADLDESDRSRAWDEVRDCLRQFEADGRFVTRLEFIIASGASAS